jgi:signal transduction histidine kinase
MKRLLMLFMLLGAGILRTNAQVIPDLSKYKTTKEKLKVLANICDSLAKNEQLDKEKIVARYALTITPANDWYYLSVFNFNLGFCWESSRLDTSIYFHEKSLQFARKANNPAKIMLSLERLLFIYINSAGYQEHGEKTLKEMLAAIDTTRDEQQKAASYGTIGNYYSTKGQYETQIMYLLKAIEIKKRLIASGKIKDREELAVDLMSLGELYLELEQGDKALAYSLEAKKYIIAHQPYINHHYKDMMSSYLLLKKPENAKVYYDSLAAMLTPDSQNRGRRHNKIAADLTFADYYLTNNQLDSAQIYMDRANALAENWSEEYLMSQVNYMTGALLTAKKDYRKALPFLKASEPMSSGFGLQIHVALLQSLAKCYAATGQWQLAYNYYDKYAPLRDSLYQEASKKSIADAEAIYQNKDKQQQIEIKNLQIDEVKKQRIWLVSGVSFLALSLMLLGIIYRNKRKNAEVLDQKNREMSKLISELEEANRTKAKLFSIISHDLRSPISQVYQFLKLQQLNPNLLSDAQKSELSEKIQTATGSLLETMEDLLLWSKTQINQFKPDMQPVDLAQTTDQCLKLLQLNMEAKKISIENHITPATMVEADPYYLQAIVRNLLQNAIKASGDNGTIQLQFLENDLEKYLSIENSGPAFSQADYETILSKTDGNMGLNGLGLRLVDELSEKTGLKIRFENPSPALTVARIFFPSI